MVTITYQRKFWTFLSAREQSLVLKKSITCRNFFINFWIRFTTSNYQKMISHIQFCAKSHICFLEGRQNWFCVSKRSRNNIAWKVSLFLVFLVCIFPYSDLIRRDTFLYSIFLRIQSECRKIRTRKTPNKDTFYAA